jgi:UDP-N-acetylglucosamine 4,6-dehydratase/5-epimerase
MALKKTRVLVSGACGSIGSAIIERLLEDGHTVCAFDQSEDGLFGLDQKFNPKYKDRLKLFIGNVRDEKRLSLAFEDIDIVFHCAALKHVYLSEYNPFEAMQTNIIGTNNIINAAIKANVKKVIFTSSDKAVNPSSTMGATKLLGERLITAANHYSGRHNTKFSSVRFGNVLNSNGSVLHIFKRQISENLPLTITSKEMSRFFITMSQAVDLCLEAAVLMVGGEVFVKSMGCCSIMNLAKSIINQEKFKYEEIGLKSGEKEFEELVTESESSRTRIMGNLYIIIPDTLQMMPDSTCKEYSQKYEDLPKLGSSLRSDKNMLTDDEVRNMLQLARLLD